MNAAISGIVDPMARRSNIELMVHLLFFSEMSENLVGPIFTE